MKFISRYSPRELLRQIARTSPQLTKPSSARASLFLKNHDYRQIVETVHDGIAIHQNGKLVFVNPAAAKLIGAKSPGDLIGTAFLEYVHPDYRAIVIERAQQSREGKVLPQLEEKFIRLDGSVVDVEVTAIPSTYQGEPATQVIIRDITARKQAEKIQAQRANEFSVLYDLAQDLSDERELDSLLYTIVTRTTHLLGATSGAIYLYDVARNELEIAAATHKAIPLGTRLQLGDGMAGRVAQTRQLLIVNDYQTWEYRSAQYEGINLRAVIEVPMLFGGTLIGVLTAEEIDDESQSADTPRRQFNEQDARLLSLFAAQAASAVHNARLWQETRARTEQLTLINQISMVVNQPLTLAEVLDNTLYELTHVLNVDRSGVAIFKDSKEYLTVIAEYNPTGGPSGLEQKIVVQGNPSMEFVLRKQRPFVATNAQDESLLGPAAQVMRAVGTQSIFIVPLLARDEVIGTMGFDSKQAQRVFTPSEIELAQTIANQAATAIEKARLLEETARRANEFAALHETAHDLAMPREVPVLLQTIVERAVSLFSAASGSIHLYDPSRDCLELVAARGPDLPLGSTLSLTEGAAGMVARTREPLIINNYHMWEHRAVCYEDLPYAAVMEAPLIASGELVGILTVCEMEPSLRKFTEQDAQLLSMFASQAASAVQNARLLQETRARAEQMSLLYDAGLALNSVLEPRAQLEFLFNVAMQTLHGDRVEFFRFDSAHREMVFELAVGYAESQLEILRHLKFPVSDDSNMLGWIYQNRISLNVPDLSADPRYVAIDPELHSGLWVLIEHENQVHGVLGVLSARPNVFSTHDAWMLALYANQAASALENTRLFEETKQRAQRQAALYDLSTRLARVQAVSELCETVVRAGTETLGYAAMGIYLLDPVTGDRVLQAGSRENDLQKKRLSPDEGLSAKAIRTGELQYWWDVTRKARYVPGLDEARSEVDVPIKTEESVLGVIIVEDARVDAFDSGDFQVLQSVANQLAMALERARLFDNVQQELAERKRAEATLRDKVATLQALAEIDREIMAASEARTVMELLCRRASELLRVPKAVVGVFSSDGLQVVASHNIASPELMYAEYAREQHGWEFVLNNGGMPEHIVVTNISDDNPRMREFRDREQVRAVAQCVMRAAVQPLGILQVFDIVPRHWNEDEMEVLNLLAEQGALALEKTRLFDETRHRADQLVVLNRIANAASRRLHLDELLNVVQREVTAAVHADVFSIALYDMATDELDYRIRIDRDVRMPPERTPAKAATLIYHTVTTRQALLIRDWEQEKAQFPAPQQWGSTETSRSMLVVPLLLGLEVIGAISVQAYQPNAYGEEEKRLLITIADQAAVAIRNTRLFEETQQRLAELEAVSRISTTVREAESSEEMLPSLLDETLAVLGTTAGLIAFYEPAEERLRSEVTRGWFEQMPPFMSAQESIAAFVLTTGQPYVVREFGTVAQTSSQLHMIAPNGWGGAIVPVRAGSKVIGVLGVAMPREMQPNEVHLLTTIAEITGNAVHRTRLHESLETSYLETALALANAIDARDSYTHGHCDRMAEYVINIAKEMGLASEDLDNLELAARLHDIGKIGVPDSVLLKSGHLTDDEWLLMKQHPTTGADIIQPIQRLREVVPLVRHHQERFDGKGYPDGLAGEEIPLGARIIAVADAVSAMLDDRVYRRGRTWEEMLTELQCGKGKQFDPNVIEVFMQMEEKLRELK